MTTLARRALYWTPRALSIAFIGFISMFAMDVFSERLGIWGTLVALTMHLIPSLVLTIVLILAWRWEWIGTALYGAAGALYIVWLIIIPWPSPGMKMIWALAIAAPAFLIAGLFLANWLKHSELHSRPHAQAL